MSDTNEIQRYHHLLPIQACTASEIGRWLAALGDCRARTLESLAGIEQLELDWISPVNGTSVGSLLFHIAAIEFDWLFCEILEAEFPADFRIQFPWDVHDQQGNNQTVTGDSFQKHQERLQYVREKLVQTLNGMTLSEFQRIRRLKAYDVTPEWVVHHLLQHEAVHRGQIEFLRRHFRKLSAK